MALTSRDNVILHLSLIDGIGPITIKYLIHHLGELFDWSTLYQATAHDLHKRFAVTMHTASLIQKGLADCQLLEYELALIARHSINWTTLCDKKYPILLGHTHSAPAVLYWRGDLACTGSNPIAIIGSRSANAYGLRVINNLVPKLAAAGCSIISGGAFGADIMAHRAALENDGKTVVVLGSGLLKPYPHQHVRVFEQVADTGGAVISTFALSTPPHPTHFPARNRVIAGLSKGCIVVQAAAKSGTRTTAQYALEYGRDVFAVPGLIDDPLSAGCHALLQEGASLVANADDILNTMNIACQTVQPSTPKPSSIMLEKLDAQQRRVLSLCRTPFTIDEIVSEMHEDLTTIQSILFDLELLGLCSRDVLGRWTHV